MILLVASSKDVAGLNIAKQILNQYAFSKTTKTFQENPVYQAEINGKTSHPYHSERRNDKRAKPAKPLYQLRLSGFHFKTQQHKRHTNIIRPHTRQLRRSRTRRIAEKSIYFTSHCPAKRIKGVNALQRGNAT